MWRAAGLVGVYDGVLRATVHASNNDGRRPSSRAPGRGPWLTRVERARGSRPMVGALHLPRAHAGFNQAAEIALTSLPRRDIKAASGHPSPDRPSRREASRECQGAFALRRRPREKGKVVVPVDDVETTGATLDRARGCRSRRARARCAPLPLESSLERAEHVGGDGTDAAARRPAQPSLRSALAAIAVAQRQSRPGPVFAPDRGGFPLDRCFGAMSSRIVRSGFGRNCRMSRSDSGSSPGPRRRRARGR